MPPLVSAAHELAPPQLGSTCHAVVAHYSSNATQGLAYLELVQRALPTECRIVVYDKSESPCTFMDATHAHPRFAECHTLNNTGREGHTFAHHIARNYGALPAWLILLTSSLSRHSRSVRLQRMVDATIRSESPLRRDLGAGFVCYTRGMDVRADDRQRVCHLDRFVNCRMPCYSPQGPGGCYDPSSTNPAVRPAPASAGLGPWLREHVDATSSLGERLCHMEVCQYGIAITTRENLLAHPRSVYEDVEREMSRDIFPETIFYTEWGAAPIFGALWARSLPGTCDSRTQGLDSGRCERMDCVHHDGVDRIVDGPTPSFGE